MKIAGKASVSAKMVVRRAALRTARTLARLSSDSCGSRRASLPGQSQWCGHAPGAASKMRPLARCCTGHCEAASVARRSRGVFPGPPIRERVPQGALGSLGGRRHSLGRAHRTRPENRHRVLQDHTLPGLLLATFQVGAEIPKTGEYAGRELGCARAALHALEAEADLEVREAAPGPGLRAVRGVELARAAELLVVAAPMPVRRRGRERFPAVDGLQGGGEGGTSSGRAE